MLKIGSLEIDTNILLAPMAGVSDSSFRLLCREFGARFTFLEMINARAISADNKKTRKMLDFDPKDKPIGFQLLGRELGYLLKALDAVREHDFALINLNAACPVKKVCRRGEGASLMKEPQILKKILAGLAQTCDKPVTLKIRSGWDEASKNAVDISLLAQDCGAQAIFIHGRTREQFYKATVDYRIIAEVKKHVSIPVIGSGDVWSAAAARKMFEETGCDAVLVARGALGRPWIFKEIPAYLETGIPLPAPSREEIIAVILRHFALLDSEHGEKNAVALMRKFVGWYFKNQPHARSIRQKINAVKTKQDFLSLIESTQHESIEKLNAF